MAAKNIANDDSMLSLFMVMIVIFIMVGDSETMGCIISARGAVIDRYTKKVLY